MTGLIVELAENPREVLTRTDSPADALTSFGGKKVGVVSGSVQEAFATTRMPGANVTKFKDSPSAIGQLLSGGIDAFVVGGPDAEAYLAREKSLKIAARADSTHRAPPSRCARATRRWSPRSYMRLYRKWFTSPVSPRLVEFRPGLAVVVDVSPSVSAPKLAPAWPGSPGWRYD